VQKRLHRPGWHVSWNKKYQHDKGSEELAEIESKNATERNHDEFEFPLSENAIKEEEEIEGPKPTIEVSVAEDEIENKPISTSIENNTSTQQTTPTNNEKKEDSKKTKWHPNYSLGILFTVLFLLCGALILLILNNTAETPDQEISKYVMSGLLAIISLPSFILAIVLFFSPAKKVKNISEVKKVKEKDKKEIEKMSKRTNYVLLVLAILLVLLIVLIALN
jgi:Na+/glutamate symporter